MSAAVSRGPVGPDGGPGGRETEGPGRLAGELRAHRLVGIVRHPDTGTAEEIARAVLAGGLHCVEVTWTVPDAPGVIRRLAADHPDRYLGAGTVVHPEQAEAVAAAGARYVVTPAVRPSVVAACAAAGVGVLPGVMTPTELYRALDLGVTAVKLFPAGTLGTGHLAALREIEPDVAYVPTGGVDADSARDWLGRGATAVAVGSLFARAHAAGGAPAVERAARTLVSAVASAPAERSGAGT